MAKLFQKEFFNDKPYMAMHWRYDRRDFLSESRCSKFYRKRRSDFNPGPDFILTYRIACEILLPILENPTQLAVAIYEQLNANLIQNLYIAAPPNEKGLFSHTLV